MQTITGQFYLNEKTYALKSQFLFPDQGSTLSLEDKFFKKPQGRGSD